MKWKVYISSTFKDLKGYRADVISLFQNQLKDSFELSEIMELMYDKGTYAPYVEDCINAVIDADIYIVILGNKTGSFPPDENRTYTEIELDTALSKEKYIFCLRLEHFDEDEIDNKSKHHEILNKFEGRPIHFFRDIVSLKNSLYEFLIQFTVRRKEDAEKKIKDYTENEEFRKFLIELSENTDIRDYCNLPPFIFGNIIRVMDVDDTNKEFEKYRAIGGDRYSLIRDYFDAYLNLSKYSILSILWDEIRRSNIKKSKKSIYKLLTTSKINEAIIDTLVKLCDEILQKFGKRKEKAFIESLMPSFEVFKDGVSIFGSKTADLETLWNSEQLLQRLMTCSKFLNQYQIRSIRARYYVRHRNDDREHYTFKYSNKQNEFVVVNEDQVNEKFVNIHSLYLCQKEHGGDIVINLSPFYFDKNSHDPNAAKIKLFAFERIILYEDKLYFNYLPISNPREKDNKLSSSNIAIGEKKITSEALRDAENQDIKRKLERHLAVHKINRLFEQFIPFFNVISENHV